MAEIKSANLQTHLSEGNIQSTQEIKEITPLELLTVLVLNLNPFVIRRKVLFILLICIDAEDGDLREVGRCCKI